MDKKIPSNIIELSQNETSFGRMNDASGSAYMKGLCGDEMEFYLVIENNVVIQVKYYTDGCVFTKACAAAAAKFASNKSLNEVLKISPQQVIDELKELPQDHLHCSILAVSALHKAVADYLLKP
jgi:nitrogen fixation NifU-like protein